MTMTDEQEQSESPFGTPTPQPVSARQVVNDMVEAGLLDDVMAKVDSSDLWLTGQGGFLPEMIKAVLERGLAVELSDHLGYEKGDPAGRGAPNTRNGSTPKTVLTEAGPVGLDVPRGPELRAAAGPQGHPPARRRPGRGDHPAGVERDDHGAPCDSPPEGVARERREA